MNGVVDPPELRMACVAGFTMVATPLSVAAPAGTIRVTVSAVAIRAATNQDRGRHYPRRPPGVHLAVAPAGLDPHLVRSFVERAVERASGLNGETSVKDQLSPVVAEPQVRSEPVRCSLFGARTVDLVEVPTHT